MDTFEYDGQRLPCKIDIIRQIRTGKVKEEAFGVPDISSGIFKIPLQTVKVSRLGCEGDERAYEPHTGPDNALMHYASQHYPTWKKELPHRAHLFEVGAFGENLVSQNLNEENVCIGDTLRFGEEVIAQVTKPRMPCFKLNHRFEVRDMSLRTQNLRRTGWYYRVLQGGWLRSGDEIVLLERKYPRWTISHIQHKLFKDTRDVESWKELAYMPELGEEIKTLFLNRLTKRQFADDSLRLGVPVVKWSPFKLVSRREETARIASFVFEAVDPDPKPQKVEPGSHIRVKVGEEGKLVRAYSVVRGDSNSFELGIAFDKATSRGGSMHLHTSVKIGDILSFSDMKSDFPIHDDADKHIMIAGGIGITAFIATAKYLEEKGLKYHLYYAIRSDNDKAFGHLLEPLKDHVTILNGSKGQRLDLGAILQQEDARTHIYVCGSDRLLAGVTAAAAAAGFPTSNIHSEAFSTATSGDPFSVELRDTKQTLHVKSEETLLDVLRNAGFDIPSTCEVGNCGTCKVEVCGGKIEHRGTGLMDDEKKDTMLSCVSRGIGAITLVM